MTRAEIDTVESGDIRRGAGPKRPRDAATLILLDSEGGAVRVLMGRRHMRHAFMPGKFVFPGGRTDPADGRVAVSEGLAAEDLAALMRGPGRVTPARARAIALSAVRETFEEAGLLLGRQGAFDTRLKDWRGFAEHGVRPSLDGLRLVARAVTPPGRVRRFDTRFFAAWRGEVAKALPEGGPTNELEELVWLPLGDARRADIPSITRTILDELEQRLAQDPDLRPGGARVPFYRLVGKTFVRDIL